MVKNKEVMISEAPFNDFDWVRESWVNIKFVISDVDDHLRALDGNVDMIIRMNMDGVIKSMAVTLGIKDLNE